MVFLVSNIFFSPKNKNVLHLCFQNIKSYGSRNILRVQNFPLFYFVRFWIWIWICDATCDLSGLGLFCSIWCLRTFSFAPKRAGREVLSRNPTFADFSSSKSLKYKTSKLTIRLAMLWFWKAMIGPIWILKEFRILLLSQNLDFFLLIALGGLYFCIFDCLIAFYKDL